MLGVGSGFLMNLAIARTMGATEAGFYLLALAIVIFLSSLCRVGLDNTVLRFVGASAESGRRGVVHAAFRTAFLVVDRKSTRLNSSHYCASRMPSSACKKQTRCSS